MPKLTIGQIHDLLLGLKALEQQDVKLAGDVRLRIAINLGKITPIAAAYETTRTRAYADCAAAAREAKKTDAEMQADFLEASDQMRAREEEVELRTVLKTELRLDDNPKITGGILAQVWPILEGVD